MQKGGERMSEKMRHLYIASNVTVGVSFVLGLLLHFLGYSTLALMNTI